MATTLVIVESPAKAKTIQRFLDDSDALDGDVVVEASVGHIRDLPARAADVPESAKRQWEILGIEVDNDFKPLYIVSPEKRDRIRDLKKLMKDATELYLATDEDREGEAISWHLLEVLNPPASMPVKRMVFHEITPAAIQHAMDNPRDIDRRLVDAQEARRLLDRIYGYGPLASAARQKVGQGTTVGRVQSVATRLVVDRERERMAFVPGRLLGPRRRVRGDGHRRHCGRSHVLGVARAGRRHASWPAARTSATTACSAATWWRSTSRGPRRWPPRSEPTTSPSGCAPSSAARTAAARPRPFITSTFQQEAGRKLRLSASMAMRSAQSLYEAGYITYMRTDSTTLSDTALQAARREITERYGAQYVPDAPRTYAKKVKNAQEAHEAIRPAGDSFRSPEDVAREVNANDAKVYELIWKRTIASQMTDATGETVTVRLGAANPTPSAALALAGSTATSGDTFSWADVEFATSGTIITHQGFRLAYVVDRDEGDDADEQERQLPPLAEGDAAVGPGDRGARPRDPAAGPLHRGLAGQAARGARRRSTVHLRVDHQGHPGPRVRLEEGHRAGAVVQGVRGGQPARAALPRPHRLRLHRPHGGRPRRHRRRRRGARPLAVGVLLRPGRPQRPASRRAEGEGRRPASTTSTRPPSTPSRSGSTPTAC